MAGTITTTPPIVELPPGSSPSSIAKGDQGIPGSNASITNGAAHAVALTSAPTVISSVATVGTAGRVLVDQGASADPSFQAVSGDATLSSAGALTLANSAVSLAKMANLAANSVLGNNTGAVATPIALTVAQTKALLALDTVTNDAQTKAAIFPNTAPSAGQLGVGNAGGTAYAPVSVSGDATLSSTGALTVTKTGGATLTTNATAAVGQLPGTTTNDSASAGKVGEYVPADTVLGSAVSLTTGTAANVASIPLTAGDWDVAALARFTGGATTTVTYLEASISAVTGTRDTTDGRLNTSFHNGQAVFAAVNPCLTIPAARISLSSPLTIYLVAVASFGTSTCSAFGIISARRAR